MSRTGASRLTAIVSSKSAAARVDERDQPQDGGVVDDGIDPAVTLLDLRPARRASLGLREIGDVGLDHPAALAHRCRQLDEFGFGRATPRTVAP